MGVQNTKDINMERGLKGVHELWRRNKYIQRWYFAYRCFKKGTLGFGGHLSHRNYVIICRGKGFV